MDWWPCGCEDSGGNWCNANVLEADFAAMASAARLLSPGFLRVGGSMDVEARYAMSDQELQWCRQSRPFRNVENLTLCLNASRFDELISFVHAAGLKLVFGLNYPDASNGFGDSQTVPIWNATDAFSLLAYRPDAAFALELAEELAPPPGTASFSHLVDAYRALRARTDLKLLGPCVGMTSEFTDNGTVLTPFVTAFIQHSLVDALCVHSYDNDAWSSIPPRASQLKTQLDTVVKGTSLPVWCGECGPHNQGGIQNVTDRVISSFWYLDALGSLAKLGVQQFGRQSIAGGRYGLLDQSNNYNPNPDFWVAATWSQLMGPIVLDLSTGFLHCGRSDAWLAVAVVNDASNISLTVDLAYLPVLPTLELWLFTTPDLYSRTLILNGKAIDASQRPLGHLKPSSLTKTKVNLPPLSFAFFRLYFDVHRSVAPAEGSFIRSACRVI